MEEIYRIFENSQNADIRYKCATLLFRSSKWDAITYILELLSNHDETVRILSKTALNKWIFGFNGSFTKPNLMQKQKIIQLINQQSSLIGENSFLHDIMRLFL